MAHRVTMSKLPRRMACPGSETLAHVHSPPDDDSGRGDAIHAYVLLGKTPPEKWRDECQALDLSAAPAGQTELAYAYDFGKDTARCLGRVGRDYPPGDELCGTADWVALTGEAVEVWDLKTGKTTHEEARWQLVGLALAACRAHNKDFAVIGLVHVIDGKLMRGRAETLGPMELAAAAAELEAALDIPPAAEFNEGPHCRHCPAFASCPAKAGMARIAMGKPELVLNDETVPQILAAAEGLERISDEMKRSAREYVLHNPIRLPDGRTLCMQEVKRTEVDVTKARAVLPPEVLAKVVQESMTVKALDAALKDASLSKADTYKALREAGAISEPKHLELRRLKPPKVPTLKRVDEAEEPAHE